MKKSLQSKNILITGGLGFIGSNLAIACLNLGANVTIYDSLNIHAGGNLKNIEDIKNHVKIGYHDILDFDKLVENVRDQDIIFNCAASTSHPFSMREPRLDLDTNSSGTINILEAIRRFNPIARFIHIGTSTQFGRLQYKPADENHPEFPLDIYSANKSVSEKYTLIYNSAHKIRSTVLRLTNVYGPRATINSSEFTFNNFFIGLALQNKPITIFGDGAQLRNALFIDDAVDALITSASVDGTIGQTYLVAHDHHHSVKQIAEATIINIGGGRVDYLSWPIERRATEVGDAVISNNKIKSEVGWKPKYDLSEGLLKTAEYFIPRLDSYITK